MAWVLPRTRDDHRRRLEHRSLRQLLRRPAPRHNSHGGLLLRPLSRRPGTVRRDPPADPQRPPVPRHRPDDDLADVLGAHPMLVDDARGNASDAIAAISRHDAEQIPAGLARRYWPPDAAQLPWSRPPIPSEQA